VAVTGATLFTAAVDGRARLLQRPSMTTTDAVGSVAYITCAVGGHYRASWERMRRATAQARLTTCCRAGHR
jgi:hypothetical protein